MGYDLDPAAIRQAEAVIRRVFPPTPLLAAPRLGARVGARVSLKLDCLTPVRTFKLRGALNKLQALADAGVPGGVVTASAGNHGLAVARAARLYGRPATVCVPAGANPQKVAAIQAEGARVVAGGQDYFEAFQHCLALGRREGLALVHAYDDPDIIAGQGTLGLEVLDQGDFDAVLGGVGGGGLMAGVAVAIRTRRPAVRVVGVQPEGADSMVRSLAAGRLVAIDRVDTFADGLAARQPGEWTFALSARWVDRVLRVSDAEILDAMRVLLREERVVAEPAGAAAVAALLKYGGAAFGQDICVLVTGGNIADAVLDQVLQP